MNKLNLLDEGELLFCDICERGIAAHDFCGLNRIGENQYLLVKRGLQVGDLLECDVYAHSECLMAEGKQIGNLPGGFG